MSSFSYILSKSNIHITIFTEQWELKKVNKSQMNEDEKNSQHKQHYRSLCLLKMKYNAEISQHSLPAGRKSLQAAVLLTWQQFLDSSFEMLATLFQTEKQESQNVDPHLLVGYPSLLSHLNRLWDFFFTS